MPELYSYPRFSLAERDRRWKAVRKKMAEQNIDVIVTPQNTGHSMDFQANTRYLTPLRWRWRCRYRRGVPA
jgi:hypothetical protein